MPWSRLFEMTFAPQYRLINVEFLSTFIFRPCAPDQPEAAPQPAKVSFRLCGGAYDMSLAEFENAIGLYTEEEWTMPIYTSAIHTADDAVVSAWWPRIGDEPFVRAARVTRIRDPFIRYLHRFIASSITGRRMSQEWCKSQDLFFLYCVLSGRPCNVARCLAGYFSTYYHHQERGLIFDGVYVTRLARVNALIDIESAADHKLINVYIEHGVTKVMTYLKVKTISSVVIEELDDVENNDVNPEIGNSGLTVKISEKIGKYAEIESHEKASSLDEAVVSNKEVIQPGETKVIQTVAEEPTTEEPVQIDPANVEVMNANEEIVETVAEEPVQIDPTNVEVMNVNEEVI
ncbi:hypothetical protein R6Q57_024821 [Mikania cordata]